MAVKIFPSVNDVAPTTGDGITIKEANLVSLIAAFINKAFVMSGLTVPASSVNLNLSVALGEAFIKGYWVKLDAATTVACTASSTNHIFLGLTKDGGGNVTGATFTVNTTGTAPADSVKIATAVTSGSAVTSTTDVRVFNRTTFKDDSSFTPPGYIRKFSDFITTPPASDDVFGFSTNDVSALTGVNATFGIVEISVTNSAIGTIQTSLSGFIALSGRERVFNSYSATGSTSTTQKRVILGFTDGSIIGMNVAGSGNGCFFRVEAAGSGVNIFAVTKNGASETTTDTGIADGAAYHEFEIRATAFEVKYYIDGNLVATHTTNIPTAALGSRISIIALEAVTKKMRVDTFLDLVPGRPT